MFYGRTLAVIRDPHDYDKSVRHTTFSDYDLEFLLELIKHGPTLDLNEVQIEMYHTTDQFVALLTIASDLQNQLMLSLKKAWTLHLNQFPIRRAQYLDHVAEHP